MLFDSWMIYIEGNESIYRTGVSAAKLENKYWKAGKDIHML